MKKKSKEKKPAKKILTEKAKQMPPDGDENKPFDFGGLPDRDLKKSMGCG